MRVISHILRFVGYATLLPFLAYLKSASLGFVVPVGLIEILFPVITFIFILGYGDVLRKIRPWDSPVKFWIANVLFYATGAGLVTRMTGGKLFSMVETMLLNFHGAFVPEYKPYLALDAVGGLSFVILAIWMPVAAVLSMIALASTLRQCHQTTLDTIS